jgi:hypothetical protein
MNVAAANQRRFGAEIFMAALYINGGTSGCATGNTIDA